jgi:hypothetical protein
MSSHARSSTLDPEESEGATLSRAKVSRQDARRAHTNPKEPCMPLLQPAGDDRPTMHPDQQPLANHLLNTLELALEKAVAHAGAPTEFAAPAANSLEAAMVTRLRALPAANQHAAIARALSSARASTAVRAQRFGPLAQVNLRTGAAVADQAQPFAPVLPLGTLMQSAPPVLKPASTLKPFNTLELRVRRVTCIDETDGFLGTETGHDEFGVGVIRLEPDGQSATLGTVSLGGGFDDGDTKAWDDAHAPALTRWSFTADKFITNGDKPILVDGKPIPVGWPRLYAAILLPAELDNGGMNTALATLLNQARTWISAEVTKAVAAGLTTLTGPIIGAIIGKVAGEIVDWVLGGFIKLLIMWWGDDFFITVSPRLSRPNPIADFKGTPGGSVVASPAQLAYRFHGHGGEYELVLDWRLH